MSSYYKESCTKTPYATPLPRGQTTTTAPVPRGPSSSIIVPPRSTTNVHDSEFIYVDCLFNNTTDLFENIVYNASRNVPILTERSNYKVGCISINGRLILPLIARFTIRLYMAWTTTGNVAGFTTYDHPTFTVWDTGDFVSNFNAACVALWAQAKADYDAAGGDWDNDAGIPLLPSGMSYDNDTQCFTIYGDTHFNEANVPGYPGNNLRALFYLGGTLAGKLAGCDLSYSNIDANNNYVNPQFYVPGYVRVIFDPGFGNQNIVTIGGDQYIENVQSSPSCGSWNDTNSLVVMSDSLGHRRVDLSRSFNTVTNSTDVTANILDSFPISIGGGLDRFAVYANPNINYCDILSNGPLDRLNFSIYILDSFGNLLPLKVPPGGTVVCRLVFARTTFTSN